MMKNIEASVSAVLTHEKKPPTAVAAATEDEIQEEDYHQMRNEVVFCLREDVDCKIRAQIEWCENSKGEIIGEPSDIYFIDVLTGQPCKNPWACVTNIIGWNEYSTERWETICMRINIIPKEELQEIVSNEKRHIL